MHRCHYTVATTMLFLAVLTAADGSWRSNDHQEAPPPERGSHGAPNDQGIPQQPRERGPGSHSAQDDQEPPRRPEVRGSGSHAAPNNQGTPQQPRESGSGSHGAQDHQGAQRPTRCARPPQRNSSLPLPLPNRTQNSTEHRGNHSAPDMRPIPPNRSGSDSNALPPRDAAVGPEQTRPRNDGGDISSPDAAGEGACPEFPRNGQSSSSSAGMLLAADRPNDGAEDSQRQHRATLLPSRGVILVAVGGVLLGAGLATLALALYLHKRSLDRVRAAVKERQNAVAPIPAAVAAWSKGEAPLPQDVVVVVDCAEARAMEPDCVCLGMVVEDAPVKLV